ncbi:MAG TPA: beta-phosphoglucomutase family hydrolase [Bacillota bacterium]|nr:beta-phosphoglucomutase family hydrolase [Bacillota bacterium]HPT86990.1 beta-phosphoglucomutase family hydrolase [Bacillota bacterium]
MPLTVDPRARGLIFDIDGTLIDTMPAHLQAWQETARRYGFEYPEKLFYQLAGMSTGEIVHYINCQQGLNLDPETIIQAKNEAYLRLNENIQVIKPVFRIVQEYAGKLPMALGTGEYRQVALVNLQITGLDRYFDKIVTADDVTRCKPDPETFLKCAELMKIPPEYCQVFEDGDKGLEAARRGGMIATDVRPFLKADVKA